MSESWGEGVVWGGCELIYFVCMVSLYCGVSIKVTCFEKSPLIGGVYTKSYDSTLLTTSSLLTSFSDYSDGKEDRPRFW
jgi:hypothetical protein